MSSLKCVAHVPIQHRDGKKAWCHICGLDENFNEPTSFFKDDSRKRSIEKLHEEIVEAMTGNAVYSEVDAHSLLNALIRLSGGKLS